MLENTKVPALNRAFLILDLIAKKGVCSVIQLQKELSIPKSSLYNILEELCNHNFLIKNKIGEYTLWLKCVELSNHVLEQIDLRTLAKPLLTELMEETGLVCHLGILNQGYAFYVLKIESNSSIRVHSYEGKKLALERSGIGKCLLAFQTTSVIESTMMNLHFIKKTENSIPNACAYLQELQDIKIKGWSFDNGEDVEGVRCIAAPIFNSSNQLEAAISIVGASIQINESNKNELVDLTVQCAKKISKLIGSNIK